MLRELPIGKLAGILGMERTTLTRNPAPLEDQNGYRSWRATIRGPA
jgi:hypothetical protein